VPDVPDVPPTEEVTPDDPAVPLEPADASPFEAPPAPESRFEDSEPLVPPFGPDWSS
jgi:hypothetical protein